MTATVRPAETPQATPGELARQFATALIAGATMPPVNQIFESRGLTGWTGTLASIPYWLALFGLVVVLNRPVLRRRKAQGRPGAKIVAADLAADTAGSLAGYWLAVWALGAAAGAAS